MAIGHTLQHIGLLYQGQDHAGQRRQTMQQDMEALKAALTKLKQENETLRVHMERQEQQLNSLIGLNLTVYQIKNEVDSLTHTLAKAA
jgi:50S ribosomal subunit-associated GTPase HflX